MKYVVLALAAALALNAGSAAAETAKEADCGHQAAIVSAIQKARMDRVKERKVSEAVLAGEVTWPERYNAAIPLFTGEIYKLKKRDLRKTDLGAQWKAACLAN